MSLATVQLHELQVSNKKSKKRVGRGGKRGTYSGRGVKGQKSRAGHRIRPAIREFIKSIPKIRGYRFQRPAKRVAIVNLRDIAASYREGETVSPKSLLQKKLIRRHAGRVPAVKVLGEGTISFPVRFEDIAMSKTAKEKIDRIISHDVTKRAHNE